MKLIIDTTERTLTQVTERGTSSFQLYSREAFELLSYQWTKVGWDQKYSYSFTWLGRPVIQLPEDLIRVQEVVYRVRPEVIIETGIAHGGSLIYYASLCKLMGRGRVIGVDLEIRPHNRSAIEAHEMSPLITLLEGSSTSPDIVRRVHSLVRPGEVALIVLDSNHTKQHVADELAAYSDLVTPGSYIIAADGFLRELSDSPRGDARWGWDNPAAAVTEFVGAHPEFVLEQPCWPFNESELANNITYWSDAWLRRK
jgi:cephalosporin hydroxylase